MKFVLMLAILLAFHTANASKIDELLLKAEAGDGSSQYLLGLIYAEGAIEIKRNKEVSDSWYSKALLTLEANQATLSPIEQNYLANMYINKLGGADQNLTKALDLIISAAERHHTKSQLGLIQIYLGSYLASRDTSKAKFWALEVIKNDKELATKAAELMLLGYAKSLAWEKDSGSNFGRASHLLSFALTSSPVSGFAALVGAKQIVDLQSLECRTSQLPDLYIETLMWMLIAKSLQSEFGKYAGKIKDALTSSQILEGERLARLCIDSKYELCGYDAEPELIDYQINSDIFASDDKWIVSECSYKNKIIKRKLTNNLGYIQHDFSAAEGILVQESEALFDGTRKELRKFIDGLLSEHYLIQPKYKRHRTYSVGGQVLSDTSTEPFSQNRTLFSADGTLSSSITFKPLSSDIRERTRKRRPDLWFEKYQETKYSQDESIKSIITFAPIDPRRVSRGRDQQFLSEEFFTEKGVLSKKIIYRESRPHWEEIYNDDGSLDRKKRLR